MVVDEVYLGQSTEDQHQARGLDEGNRNLYMDQSRVVVMTGHHSLEAKGNTDTDSNIMRLEG